MRVLFAAIIAVALAAIPTSIAASSSSGLEGKVLRGPVSPVCVAMRPCTVSAAVTLAFSRGGVRVAQARSIATGRYRIPLAPGAYSVSTAYPHPLWRISPATVRVPEGGYRRVNFLIDTGIR
jgi:hypothetical protein